MFSKPVQGEISSHRVRVLEVGHAVLADTFLPKRPIACGATGDLSVWTMLRLGVSSLHSADSGTRRTSQPTHSPSMSAVWAILVLRQADHRDASEALLHGGLGRSLVVFGEAAFAGVRLLACVCWLQGALSLKFTRKPTTS